MDTLRTLQIFVRVVEAGSFSAVAQELGSTQSAVSKQVAALEQRLGTKLLVRITRSLALTDEGRDYFASVRRLVAELSEADALVGHRGQLLQGNLRLAASVGFGRLCLMPLIDTFLDHHREVRIDVRLDDGHVDLVEQGIDVAVRIGEMPDSGLLARRAGQSVREVLAHRRYLDRLPAGQALPAHPQDLLQHNCIVYTGTDMRRHWHLVAGEGSGEAPGTGYRMAVAGNLQTDSSEVVRTAVLAGMGVGYTPTWLFHEEIARGDVVRLLLAWSKPSPIYVVTPRERQHSAKMRAFMDHITAGLAKPG
ncbi:MAG: HTH-type transcriptional regulator DmlR [Stenotrophomonas maltophilia]|uniref:HTH-type transcriptional regulator DmlR n=1 Tax=Stenotrophomonas maltophilia TaxID=40324 RepID=A0A7V8FDR7_STEMA|nr:MAG: HTH-type transcriptional regulator DmlR [Stenotrophomonas maltophilia]